MKTILITGASSGIGKACSDTLYHGNRLIICARRKEKLDSLRGDLESLGGEILTYEVDVKDKKSVNRMFDDLASKKIYVDVLINNAGLALGLENLSDGDTSDWDNMIDTNIKGLLYVTHKFLNGMVGDNKHIINMGSIAGIYSYQKGVVYSATKSAVKFISDGLRKELFDKKVKVTNIQPGLVETDFSSVRFKGDKDSADSVYKNIEALQPEDIADLVKYVITRPSHVQISEVTIMPTNQGSVDLIHKE